MVHGEVEAVENTDDVAFALEYMERVYDHHRAPGSLDWDQMKPRVEKYLRHLLRPRED
jgi:hypothetical protein